MAHEPQGLAIAAGAGHPEISGHVFLDVVPLLVADEEHRQPVDGAHPTHDGPIVGSAPVTVEFIPVVAERLDVVEGVGPSGVPRHLDALGRREVGVDLLATLDNQLLQLLHLHAHVQFAGFGFQANLLNPRFQLQEGPFKIRNVAVGLGHGVIRRAADADRLVPYRPGPVP